MFTQNIKNYRTRCELYLYQRLLSIFKLKYTQEVRCIISLKKNKVLGNGKSTKKPTETSK